MVLQLSENEIEEFVQKVNFEKEKGLVPVIVQDASNDRVLMLAYMDREALRLTLTSGRLHFWSRRRGRIWLKGEESGHHALLQNAVLDCDDDTILFKVQQIGAVCHTGQETCFHKPIIVEKEHVVDAKIVERIFEVIVDRLKNPTRDSYVSRLTGKGEDVVLQKIGEETVEFIIATKGHRNSEIIHEATDILFHILVLLAQKGFEPRRIFEELQNRHKVKTQSCNSF